MKKQIVLKMLTAALLLSGCSTAGTGAETQTAAAPGQERAEYPLDTYYGNDGRVAEDAQYYYFTTYRNTYALDKSDWHIEKVCRDSLCEHKGKCVYSAEIACMQGVGGQIYMKSQGMLWHYFPANTIYRFKEDWKRESFFAADTKIIMMYGVDDDGMLYSWYDEVSDKWGVNQVSLSGGADSALYDQHIGGVQTDEEWYYFWDTGRMWRISKKTGVEEELTAEYVSGMRLIGEDLYYTCYDEAANQINLKVMDKNGGEGRLVLECVLPQCFHFYDGKILYTSCDLNNRENMRKLYAYDMTSGESRLLAEEVLEASLLPGDEKLLIVQEANEDEWIYSLIDLDGSNRIELLTVPTKVQIYN